jgi:hypothetical protein
MQFPESDELVALRTMVRERLNAPRDPNEQKHLPGFGVAVTMDGAVVSEICDVLRLIMGAVTGVPGAAEKFAGTYGNNLGAAILPILCILEQMATDAGSPLYCTDPQCVAAREQVIKDYIETEKKTLGGSEHGGN